MIARVATFLVVCCILLGGQLSCVSGFRQMLRNLSNLSRGFTSMTSKKSISVSDILKSPKWPEQWPFSPRDFARQDESPDSSFYSQPRFVHHIDDHAIESLTKYYKATFPPGSSVLDICSSWVSHFPPDSELQLGHTAGIGMNGNELRENKQLKEYCVQDLNVDPLFPYADNSFDFVTCVVSVDYLTRPLEVFSEIRRVLKPGGQAIISQSNRCFPTKAIDIWLRTNDMEHVFIIGAYFHYAGGFDPAESIDISPNKGFYTDPMFIIKAAKSS